MSGRDTDLYSGLEKLSPLFIAGDMVEYAVYTGIGWIRITIRHLMKACNSSGKYAVITCFHFSVSIGKRGYLLT